MLDVVQFTANGASGHFLQAFITVHGEGIR